MKEVDILKNKLELCRRECKCGCGKTWMSTSSTNEYFSNGHKPWYSMSFKAMNQREKEKNGNIRKVSKYE